jgi:SHS2 domain-containing protein
MTEMRAGYRELDHTADWALRVWAPDLEGLFVQAAAGMFSLMGVTLHPEAGPERKMTVDGADAETMLVNFLGDLLLVNEQEQTALAPTALSIEPDRLTASCSTARVLDQEKEIKAVTFHELEIRQRDGLLETVIVFDV